MLSLTVRLRCCEAEATLLTCREYRITEPWIKRRTIEILRHYRYLISGEVPK